MAPDASHASDVPERLEGPPRGPNKGEDVGSFVEGHAWLAGAAAGLWLAFADFGAVWLWLPLWRDRAALLGRLVATLVPVGAALGALLGLALLGSGKLASHWGKGRTGNRIALGWTLLAAPALRVLAVKLCSGGMMARLAQHDLIEWGLSALLPALLYLLLRTCSAISARIDDEKLRSEPVAIALLALSFALSKVNQTVLPNLYDYLHAALVVAAWLSAGLGLALGVARGARFERLRAKLDARLLRIVLITTMAGTFVVNTLTLDSNLNVRVSMFDPRSPSSRALLAAANPLLRKLERQTARPRGALTARKERSDLSGLPAQEGAHILLVTIDALRADHLGAYGYTRPVSPGLDALAKHGLMFRRAYAQAPHSSYSLSSLHTSEYIHEVVELPRPLPTPTLASVLRDAGYHTAAFFTDGIFHTEGHKLAQYRDSAFGFALFDHTNRESEDQTDRVLSEVERIREQGEPPSLLWVHYFDVHEPYQETTFGSGDMDRYDSEILHTDRELARLIKELDARLTRPLVIAVSADHGEEFREHGGVYHGSTLFEEQVRVPLLFRAQGYEAKLVEAPVEVIDIAPTLLGMVGVPVPPSMRGRDLRAYAAARSYENTPVFSAVLTKRMAVRWPHKLIADLRFGLFELYDLATDPEERRNLAQQRPGELATLRSDVYGWLDSLESTGTVDATPEEPRARALRWGRLGDRRAVVPMGELLLDESAPIEQRAEAGQILAKLADESSAEQLYRGLGTKPAQVAAEAAIALGRMYDDRARKALEQLVHTEDPYLRARAAVSLGRLRDVRAVPALIDALWVAPSLYEREEAVRWLGRLRDPRAVEPLIAVIPEFGMRYLVAVALGHIGDLRAFDALADLLSWEEHANIRDEVVRGLGLLGDKRAIPLLLPVLINETGLKNTAESLVRLGAIEQHALSGTDMVVGRVKGLSDCTAGPLLHDWDYLQRTTCKLQISAEVPLAVQANAALDQGAQLIIRLRAESQATDVSIVIAKSELGSLHADSEWREHRLNVPAGLLKAPRAALVLNVGSKIDRIELDHVLVAPLPKHQAPAGSEGAEAADHP